MWIYFCYLFLYPQLIGSAGVAAKILGKILRVIFKMFEEKILIIYFHSLPSSVAAILYSECQRRLYATRDTYKLFNILYQWLHKVFTNTRNKIRMLAKNHAGKRSEKYYFSFLNIFEITRRTLLKFYVASQNS